MKKIGIVFFALVLSLACFLPSFAEEAKTRDFSFENSLATDLKALGLFTGVSDTDFDLERAPSRVEVLVMLIRVLGEEKTAKEGQWEHPFTDVAAWADPYVGYAYEHGLTKGVSDTEFGTGTANAATYLTFVLRALGYSDADGDFEWDNPYPLAKGIGILPSFADTENFMRADIVTISYAALSAEMKDSSTLLAEKLIEANAFSAETFGANYDAAKIWDHENAAKIALSAEEIYAKCSPAVFYIEVQSANGTPIASGSGFFIDESGIAVTNHHVIEGAAKAVVTLPGSGAKYDVTGIYDANASDDWAVLQVGGSGFKTLSCNALPVKGGSTVYAIGSPKGLQNTVSAGLVSNARRVLNGETYIQTTAAISNGSSGGVLLNAYGEAIGITSNSYANGQNLNFARPISVIAAAKTAEAKPLADYNWNSVLYTVDTTEVTVREGETVEYEYDYAYYTVSGSAPSISIDSSDYTIAGVGATLESGKILICGNHAGNTTVVFSDDITSDTLVVNVTVEPNEAAVPKVFYSTAYAEIKLQIGATKNNLIALTECRLVDEPSENLAATYSVKSSSPYIRASYEMHPDGEPYMLLTVTGSKKATGSIVISNNITGDVLEIPVTVGDRYAAAYAELSEYLMKEGDFYEDKDDPDHTRYSMYFDLSDNFYLVVAYYPAAEEIYCMYAASTSVASLYVGIDLYKDGKVEYCIEMPSVGVAGYGTLAPKTFSGKDQISFTDYSGLPALKSELAAVTPTSLVTLLYGMDVIMLPSMVPGMSISDFGFVNVDFSVIGIQ